EPFGAPRFVAAAHLGRVRVDGRLECRTLRKGRRLVLQFALTSPFDGAENPLARLQIRRHRLPDLVANGDGNNDEHPDQQDGDGHEDDREGFDEQARRLAPQRTSSTGTVRSIVVVWPPNTSTVAARSPTRSCQPMTVYCPAGTPASS